MSTFALEFNQHHSQTSFANFTELLSIIYIGFVSVLANFLAILTSMFIIPTQTTGKTGLDKNCRGIITGLHFIKVTLWTFISQHFMFVLLDVAPSDYFHVLFGSVYAHSSITVNQRTVTKNTAALLIQSVSSITTLDWDSGSDHFLNFSCAITAVIDGILSAVRQR